MPRAEDAVNLDDAQGHCGEGHAQELPFDVLHQHAQTSSVVQDLFSSHTWLRSVVARPGNAQLTEVRDSMGSTATQLEGAESN